MPNPSDDELDYLLSRGMLSGPKRAQILEEASASSGPAAPVPAPAGRAWRRLSTRLVGAGLALAAGAAAFVIVVSRAPKETAPFRAKGSSAGPPIVDISCVGATLKACPRDSVLAFSVWNADGKDAPESGFVSAYSDPISAGERIWYVTNQPLLGTVVPTVARIGSEHRPGGYRAHVVLSRLPLSRAEIVAATATTPDITARAMFQIEVLP
jgi:hypothetical protein